MPELGRLYAIVEYLRRRRARAVTVPELAERFQVSERTIFRDLSALRDDHVPIEGDPGRGGGLRLAREYSLPPLNFRVGEAIALWLSARMAMAQSALPWSESAGVAQDKVFGALVPEERRRAEGILERIVIGAPVDPAIAASASPVSGQVLAMATEAFERGCLIAFRYRDGKGNATQRTVEPHGLGLMAPLWYLLAFDPVKAAPRMFRLDRMSEARVELGRRFDPQNPRDLMPEWAVSERRDGR